MATGGFKPNATTDFLEEWKAKREKMRAKMLGDIAAATGACAGNIGASTSASLGTSACAGNIGASASASLGTTNSNKSEPRIAAPNTELNNNGNADRGGSAAHFGSSCPIARSASSSALKRPEEEAHPAPTTPGSNLKKMTPQAEKVPCTPVDSSPSGVIDSDKESPSPSKGKEKKSTGPSARKGKGQIEKRKLREKRRSTGVVSLPSNESLDELDDDDGGEKERTMEQKLVQANTVQNEAVTDQGPPGPVVQDTSRSASGRYKSSTGPGSTEEDLGGNGRHQHARQGREANPSVLGGLERRMESLEKELVRERQENARLVKSNQDKDELIGKLKEEVDLLNRDLDDIEDENDQLKQENKTLLKVVGQLTR